MTQPPFGSTLSADGFAALLNAGFRPLRQVQGTSVLSLGWQRRPSRWMRGSLAPLKLEGAYGEVQTYYSKGALAVQQYLNEGGWFELEERTAVYNDARTQALARLRGAAREAGALAVVDVRIRRGMFAHATRAFEFSALGTAIASDRFDLEEDEPIPLVSLGGGDFWKLLESGYWPLGLVGGTSVVYVVSGLRTKYARFRPSRRSIQNQEYEDYTQGLAEARLRATGRLRHEARQLRASGVLGIEVRHERHEQSDDNLMVTMDLLGNAVVPIDGRAPRAVRYALGVAKS